METTLIVEAHRCTVGQANDDLTIRLVKSPSEVRQVVSWILGELQAFQQLGLRDPPGLAREQLLAGVAPLPRVYRVDVAIQQTSVKLLEDAKRLRLPVHGLVLEEHEAPPGAAQERRVGLVGKHLLATEEIGKCTHRGDDRGAFICSSKLDRFG